MYEMFYVQLVSTSILKRIVEKNVATTIENINSQAGLRHPQN